MLYENASKKGELQIKQNATMQQTQKLKQCSTRSEKSPIGPQLVKCCKIKQTKRGPSWDNYQEPAFSNEYNLVQ